MNEDWSFWAMLTFGMENNLFFFFFFFEKPFSTREGDYVELIISAEKARTNEN